MSSESSEMSLVSNTKVPELDFTERHDDVGTASNASELAQFAPAALAGTAWGITMTVTTGTSTLRRSALTVERTTLRLNAVRNLNT